MMGDTKYVEFSPQLALLQSAFTLADKLCSGGLSTFGRLKEKENEKVLQVITGAFSEITHGIQHDISTMEGQHWRLKLASILVSLALRHDGLVSTLSDDISALTTGMPPFGLSLYFEVVKSCGWSEELTELLVMLEPVASKHLLLALCGHVTSHVTPRDDGAGADKMDVSLLADVCNFLLLHENKLVFNSDMQATRKILDTRTDPALIAETPDTRTDSALIPELINTLSVARLETLSKEQQARLFLALLNLSSCISRGHCPVMKHSVAECREFAASFEAFMMSGSSISSLVSTDDLDCDSVDFPHVVVKLCEQPSEDVAEKVSEILIRLWNLNVSGALWVLLTGQSETGSSTDGSVSPHERAFLVGLLLEWSSPPMILDGVTETLNATLQGIVAPFTEQLSAWLERGKDPGSEIGASLEEIDRVMFTIDERLKGYVDCSHWLVSTEDVDILLDKRWLQCVERNLDVFSSSTEHLHHLLRRLFQLRQREMLKTADHLKQVVLRIFARLPLVLRETVLDDVYRLYKPEELFGVNDDFALQLLATFNRLVNSTEGIEETLSEVFVLALQSPDQTLRKLVSEAIENPGHVTLLAKIIEGVSVVGHRISPEGCSCLCGEVHRAVRIIDPSNNKQLRSLLELLRLLLQPSPSTSKAGIIRNKHPALDLTEFLHVCVLPHVKIVAEGHSQGNSVSCGLALALLRVALETPAMQRGDWTMVVRCRLFPTILCVCSVVDVCGCLYVDYTSENLYTVKEMAVELLGTLTWIVNRQDSSRMERALTWLSQRMLSLHWTSRLYLQSLYSDCSDTLPSCPCPLSASLPSPLSALLDMPVTVHQTTADVPGEPLLLLFEGCKTTDTTLQQCLTTLNEEAFRSQPSLYTSVVTVLVEVLPHCVSNEWNRVASLLQHLITKDLLPVGDHRGDHMGDHRGYHIGDLNTLISAGGRCWRHLALSRLLTDVLLVYAVTCCHESHEMQMCAFMCRGFTEVLKNCCIDGVLQETGDCRERAICFALLLSDICTATGAFTIECCSHLQVIIQEVAGLFSIEMKKAKVAEDVTAIEGSKDGCSVLDHVSDIVLRAVEMLPNEADRQTLLKTVQ